jgi:hypothetical protein
MHLYILCTVTTQQDFVSGKLYTYQEHKNLEKLVRITDVFLTICITSTNLLGVYYEAKPWGYRYIEKPSSEHSIIKLDIDVHLHFSIPGCIINSAFRTSSIIAVYLH